MERAAAAGSFVATASLLNVDASAAASKGIRSGGGHTSSPSSLVEWVRNAENAQDSVHSSNFVSCPPSFATYLTRILINYDDEVGDYWRGVVEKSPKLYQGNYRNKQFGSLSRSVCASVEKYVSSNSWESFGNKLLSLRRDESRAKEDYGSYAYQVALGLCLLRGEDQPKELIRTAVYGFNGSKGGKSGSGGNGSDRIARIAGGSKAGTTRQPEGGSRERGLGGLLLGARRPAVSDPGDDAIDADLFAYLDSGSDPLSNLLPATTEVVPTVSASGLKSYKVKGIKTIEIGIGDEFGTVALQTVFGPVATNPLRREISELSRDTLTLLGLSGAAACGITHTTVIPLDVVKTRMQTSPGRYNGLVSGALNIVEEEGVPALFLGGQATIAGYIWYGLSVYPSYEFFKRILLSIVPASLLLSQSSNISLISGALAAVVACVGLAPIEASRIRAVAEPEIYSKVGLVGALKIIYQETENGLKNLYAGLPPLLIRQILFGTIKFFAFDVIKDAVFDLAPVLKDEVFTSLGVSLFSGGVAGVISCLVSQPADSVLTYIAIREDTNFLQGAVQLVKEDGTLSLMRGFGSRAIWSGTIIGGQFLLYDIFRTAAGVGVDSLKETLHLLWS